jgi:hypothetical protein
VPAFLFLPERFQANACAALDAGMKTGSRQETEQLKKLDSIETRALAKVGILLRRNRAMRPNIPNFINPVTRYCRPNDPSKRI